MHAVVLAAGEGRRIRPLTHARPKVLLPVGNRPILEHVLSSLHRADIKEVSIVVGYKGESIQSHFQDGAGFGLRLRYVRQPKPTGSADALARALVDAKTHDDVLVVPGDNYLGPDVVRDFLASAAGHDALLYTRSSEPNQYGVIELDDPYVTAVTERPPIAATPFISTGIARLSARRAKKVDAYAGEETGLTQFLNEEAHAKERLHAVELRGAWFDVDRPESLLGANSLHLAEEVGGVEGTVEPGASLLGPVRVGKDSRIRSGCYLVGPVMVGQGCEIGPHTVVYGPTSIGDNVTIGPFTELLECVIMADARIASGCTLHHAVLDRGVILAPRVSIDRAHVQAGPRFGAVVGDGAMMGNNVVIQPGSVVGVQARVAPHKVVGTLPDRAQVV